MLRKRQTRRRHVAVVLPVAMLILAASGPRLAFAQEARPAAPATSAQSSGGQGSAAPKPDMPQGVVPPADYVIGPEDVLSIIFWREKDLSADAAVRPDGMVTVPLLNDVHAAGLTPDQLRERIREGAAKFVEDPTVTVVVKAINSRKVFITGMVGRAGQYPLAGSMTVMQLIALAGGLQEYAQTKKILIMRTENGEQVAKQFNYEDVLNRRRLEQNITLLPGDTVIVP